MRLQVSKDEQLPAHSRPSVNPGWDRPVNPSVLRVCLSRHLWKGKECLQTAA